MTRVIAYLVLLATAIVGCGPESPRYDSKINTHDVVVGDVNVHVWGPPIWGEPSGTTSLSIDVQHDPRFDYVRRLQGIKLTIVRQEIGNLAQQEAIRLKNVQPHAGIYTVPASMTVYNRATAKNVIDIHLNGTTFLERDAHVGCRRVLGNASQSARWFCVIRAPVGDDAVAVLSFFDSDFAPEEWPALLDAIQLGLWKLVSRTTDVLIGDVVVHKWGPPLFRPPTSSFRIDLTKDPRFRYRKPLNGIFLYIENTERVRPIPTSSYAQRFRQSVPPPGLYDAPESMTVYALPNVNTDVIQINGTHFFAQPAYAACERTIVRVGDRANRLCVIGAPLTSHTTVELHFADDEFPAEDWQELLRAIETGVREITAPME